MLQLYVNNELVCKMPSGHLPFHTPTKSGERKWEIYDDETGKMVDFYHPPRKARSTPTTPFKGSWAESVGASAPQR